MFFNSLSVLMKEPVLQDKQSEHLKFCKYASELIGKSLSTPSSVLNLFYIFLAVKLRIPQKLT